MRDKNQSDLTWLNHISESIEEIQEYTGIQREGLKQTRLVQRAVERVLQTLAESTQRLTPELKATEPEIPWEEIAGLRNRLTHEYRKIDQEMVRRVAARLRAFVECAHADTRAVAAIAPGEPPALAVVHRAPVRWLRRVFDTAKVAFLVSATLAVPAARPSPNNLLRALGLGPGAPAPGRINAPGWADLQPRRYGAMDFRFADRAAPAPIRHVDGAPVSDPGHLDYVAQAIEAARRSGRVLVLCTSYRLAGELAPRVRNPIAHARGERLASRLDAFRADPNAVLLTPAAWTGLSLPGLVEHVVIPRIPFRPPSVEDEAQRRFLAELGLAPTGVERLLARDRAAAARRTLAQGIGRGIRGPRERCTVWLLDPRFPLPKSMTRAIGGPDQGLAADHLALMYAIPVRFRSGARPAVDRGRIWPLARCGPRTPPARAVTETETDRAR